MGTVCDGEADMSVNLMTHLSSVWFQDLYLFASNLHNVWDASAFETVVTFYSQLLSELLAFLSLLFMAFISRAFSYDWYFILSQGG